MILKKYLKPFLRKPLEDLPNSPDYFRIYRYFASCPEFKRFSGGWEYGGKKYPDYLFMGGASYAIFPTAKKYLKGRGADIGPGYWEFPGSIPIDATRGDGFNNKISDFSPASLDYVFSSHCLEHIANWQTALSEWISLIKPGGIIFLYLPHPDCLIWRPGAPGIGNGHKWVPDVDALKGYLEQKNMKIVSSNREPDAMMSFHIAARKS